jgi:CelD/BcsL family acetyltransferase involved in cellulose biosynthesis
MTSGPVSEEIRVSLGPLTDLAALERDWLGLQPRSDHSFFQSWTWIGCWLTMLPASIRPLLLRAIRGGRIVGLGVFVPHRTIRHGFVISNGLYLHETGRAEFDQLTIEHNGLLVDREGANAILAKSVDTLIRLDQFDELHFSGVPSSYLDLCAKTSSHLEVKKSLPLHAVDLARAAEGGYERLLSKNTRQQIRRAMRLYEGGFPSASLCCSVARNEDQARAFLDDLQRLHQAYWTARGKPGAFANPFFTAFHRRLVREALPGKEVELARISSAKGVLGYLYQFRTNGHVYSYQSGFHYEDDNRLKPGLVSHRLAIEHSLSAGDAVYDFLAGDDRYKRSLATHADRLFWLTLQKRRPAFSLERRLRAAKGLALGIWRKPDMKTAP